MAKSHGKPTVSALVLVGISLVQLIWFTAAWTFVLTVRSKGTVALHDSITRIVVDNPVETTFIVTTIATYIGAINAILLTNALKFAVSARLSHPILLRDLRAGTEMYSLSFGFGRLKRALKEPHWTLLIFLTFSAVQALMPAWSTLLVPTPVILDVDLNSTELDLGNSAFDALLAQDISASDTNGTYNAYRTIEIWSTISGMFAAASRFGFPGAFNFNGGGILPAIDVYTGPIGEPSQTGLAFAGGNVPSHVDFYGYDSNYRGLSTNYTVLQQGLSANVSCQERDLSAGQPLSLTYESDSMSIQSGAYLLQHWNVTVNCSGSYVVSNQFFVPMNASGDVDSTSEGFIPTAVCPMQNSQGSMTNQSFAIVFQGFYEYSFIPPTVCEVTPLVTTVSVQYNAGMVNVSDATTMEPLSDAATNVQNVIFDLVSWHATYSQGLSSNLMGGTIYAIYASQNSSVGNSLLYDILNDYWRGTVEFAGTYLRSAFSAEGAFPDNLIPSNMTTGVTGTMHVSTLGWQFPMWPTFRSALWPISTVAIVVYAAVFIAFRYRGLPRTDQGSVKVNFTLDDETHAAATLLIPEYGNMIYKEYDGGARVGNFLPLRRKVNLRPSL
ncbi:hypothetical protein PAXINDRAFT_167032 [Paxillus involutus ATCC 200175]|nr:hypothetical protein PAXINDRAFT_167032 [Paxillus involutus ATCC 200175]